MRAHARFAAKLAEHKEKLAERAAKKEGGQRVGGQEPKAPDPEAKDQYNFTDPESRIMKAGNGNHFEQSYNAQAAVEVESRLIVGLCVSVAPNDKQELEPTLSSIPLEAGAVSAVLVDSGYFSERAVRRVEGNPEGGPSGTKVYAAVEKTGHHRSVGDLEIRSEPEAPPPARASRK